jgi:putative transposase
MARFARVIAVNVAHHATQRGNARQFILEGDADREVYLDLLREGILRYQASLIGYCLMSNHVHLVMIPSQADALARTLKHTHGGYAAYWNAKQSSSGHVWQGRYYSCPLDDADLWAALRYAELNPVRAGLVEAAEDWIWSSAAVHCGADADGWLAMDEWRARWPGLSWREYLHSEESETETMALRQYTHTGRPLGSKEFVQGLEETAQRTLAPKKGGRPATAAKDDRQTEIVFVE